MRDLDKLAGVAAFREYQFEWPEPSRLKVALGMARQAMLSRHQFVQTSPERVKPLNFHFPLWRDGAYKPWQVDLALRILASLAPGDVPLDVRRINPEPAGEVRASQSRGWLFDSARLTTPFEQRVFRRSAENSRVFRILDGGAQRRGAALDREPAAALLEVDHLLGSVALPAFLLGLDPRRRIICVSYSGELAKKLANDFRAVVESAWYRRIFPNTRIGSKNT